MGGVVCGQTTETYTFSSFTSSKSVTLKGKNCTIVLGKGANNNPAWNKNNKEARVYGGGSLTVSSTKLISKIVYNYKKNNDITITTTPEGFTNNTWQSSTGSNNIKATLSGTSGNLGFKSLEITYLDSSEPSKTKTTLSFGKDYDGQTIIKYIGDETVYSIPATLTPAIDGAEITYESSNSKLVDVDKSGNIRVMSTSEVGSATITASYAGDDTYAPSSASYTVQVKKPVAIEDGVFDFTSGELDYGSGLKPRNNDSYNNKFDSNTSWKNGVISISTTGNTRWFLNQDETIDFRLYNKAQMTISVPSTYIINKIQFEGEEVSKMSTDDKKYTSGAWTGNSNNITFTGSGTNKIQTITVTYYKALTTAASSFATYAADDAVDYSAVGLEAYAIDLNEAEGKVAYNKIEGTVKAGTPVLVKGEASTSYAMIPSTADATDVTTALQISDGSVVTEGKLYYGFATIDGVSGFKLVKDGLTIPAKKGYLKLSSASNAKTFYAFDGNATGIEETFSKADSEKAFAPMYNISGQRVGEGYKGIVIVNGKKYMK